MNKKLSHSRRDFIKGALTAGLSFSFAEIVQADENNNSTAGSAIPLATQRITQPENPVCAWVGFSPVNDQMVFVSGMIDRCNLYISPVGKPESFELLWEPTTDSCAIKGIAWSPNGQEIAFIIQAINDLTTPKSAKISIYIVDVVSRSVREPIIIGESIGGEDRQLVNVSYKKGLSWWGNSFICVPANDGGVMKFDAHTGQYETLISPQDGFFISSVALTQTGELRFVKARKLETSNEFEFVVCALRQDGSLHDYTNLTQQLGQIFGAHLSQDADYVFVKKHNTSSYGFPTTTNLIYKVEPYILIGQIPSVVHVQKDIYTYVPLSVRNGNELILIESVSLAVEGSSSKRIPQMKVAKLTF